MRDANAMTNHKEVKYFFFVDDSGSKDWETPYAHEFTKRPPDRTDANIKFWRGNYFVLAGLHVSREAIAAINPLINAAKEKYFGTKFVEIKSEWLRNPHQRRKRYLDPFRMEESTLRSFVEEEWYGFFARYPAEVQIQAFVLDKRFYYRKRFKVSPFQELVQVLFDRVELHPHAQCEIMFDQMEADIQSTKHRQGTVLKISKQELDLHSFSQKYSHTGIRFEKSLSSNFLQLADTAAYNVYRQFVQRGDSWEGADGDTLREYAYFSRIEKNFYCVKGRVAGYGIVIVPDVLKKGWGPGREAQKNLTNP